MRPPCEIVTQSLLPLIRGLVAKELITRMTQQEVAEKMGVSQPTISTYLKSLSKIEEEGLEEYLTNETINQLTNTIMNDIIQNRSQEEIIRKICSACVSLRIGGLTCRKHMANFSDLSSGCQGCLPIVSEAIIGDRKKVISNLSESIMLIEKSNDFAKIIPQVLTNICECIPNPETIDEVAAIPGRITKVRGRAKALMFPEFGVSEHLAKILLKTNKINPEKRAVICLIYNQKMLAEISRQKIPIIEFSNNDFENYFLIGEYPNDSYQSTNSSMKSKDEILAIINKGAIGIEPIIYLFGENSIKVAKIAIQIASKI